MRKLIERRNIYRGGRIVYNLSDKLIFQLIGLFLILGIPMMMLLFSSSKDIENSHSFCVFLNVTGLPCPGCGITKSIYFLFTGNIEKSIHYHAGGILLPVLLVSVPFFKHKLTSDKYIYCGIAFLFFAYYLYRLFFYVKMNSFEDILNQSILRFFINN